MDAKAILGTVAISAVTTVVVVYLMVLLNVGIPSSTPATPGSNP